MPYDKIDGRRLIPPDQIRQAKGTAKYITRPQCAAQYRNGRRAGQRCGWRAQEGRIYCKKHGTMEGRTLTPERLAGLHKGRAAWIARMHEMEKSHPGLIREILQGSGKNSASLKERWRRQKAAGIDSPRLVSQQEISGTTDPKILAAQRTVIRTIAHLPPVPDKPFEQLTMAEQFIKIRQVSLEKIYEVLLLPLKDTNGDVLPKILAAVKDTALRASALGVKVDISALAEKRLDKMVDLLERLKREEPKTIEG